MIHYMPFTYIHDHRIRRLISALGPFAVCQLGPALVPSRMQPWIQQGMVTAQYPRHLDPERLDSAIKEFQQWGGLHAGRLPTMAGLNRSARNGPMIDDTAPTQISTQIRHFENHVSEDANQPDGLFQAALFMAMAQIHDEQQAAVDDSLSSVQRLEAQMLSQLTGDPEAACERGAAKSYSARDLSDQDRDRSFTDQRIEAWACLAADLEQPADLYLTCSPIVYETLLDTWSEAEPLGSGSMAGTDAVAPHPFEVLMGTLTRSQDPSQMPIDWAAASAQGEPPALLTLHILPGRTPHEFLSHLSGRKEADHWPDSGLRHTILGYLALGPE